MSNQLTDRLDRKHAAVLVVDLQEKLLPAIANAGECVEASARLIRGARVLGLPVFFTEQYPAGLGRTDPRILEHLAGAAPIEKMQFSAWTPEVEKVAGERSQFLLVGVEAHVCVQGTALDLLHAGKRVWLCADATGSRRPADRDIALDRLRQAGAVVTTVESALFELLASAAAPEFKQLLKVVK